MEEIGFESLKEKLREHLDSSRQSWLFGAGISFNSNIPLMFPLTRRVENIINDSKSDKNKQIYKTLKSELDDKSHIEHYLSHLGDLIALAERAKTKSSNIGMNKFSNEELKGLYKSIIVAIGSTVRYGYSESGDMQIGTAEQPIVEIEHHLKFVQAVYKNRLNLTSRSRLTFFTTNYDTLLEDALALEKFNVIDGFSGGVVGYWNPKQEFNESYYSPNNCLLYKLHGSIDWQKDELKRLVRVRYGAKYFANQSDIMIYPQATKYVETQKDPFSYLFSGFRKTLNSTDPNNVLITCGYSFGDEHINAEIEDALSSESNHTTLIVFIKESPDDPIVINKTLDSWLLNPDLGPRIWVAGQKGIYNNSIKPIAPSNDKDLSWWTFSGLTNFILTNEHE